MSQRGFTLIEVTVALVIGGLALSAAAALLAGLGQRADQIRAVGAREDRDANGERLLRALWGNVQARRDSAHSVTGDSTAVTFASLCETVEGWLRPCDARLSVRRTGAAFQFLLELSSRDTQSTTTVSLWSGNSGPARLRYLRDAASGGTWLTSWNDIVIPSALEIVGGTDTMLVATW
jgi:prepilin-type N-terminal cleavage/methylation domain-containing protein